MGQEKPGFHLGYHQENRTNPKCNAGDAVLLQATRDLFQRQIGITQWKLKNFLTPVTEREIEEINSNAYLLLIGGGGVLLGDQSGADYSKSGWPWACPTELLNEIRVPIIVFALGYNQFRGQPDFDPIFTDNIRALVDRSSFFSLRNQGGVQAIRNYLDDDLLKQKVCLQPCPTTISWHLYPELINSQPTNGNKTIAFNFAYDRREYRYGGKEKQIEQQIAMVLKKYTGQGWQLVVANHMPKDAEVEETLNHVGVPFQHVDLSKSLPEDVFRFYNGIDLAIGVRKHAQMIPFGLRRNIIPLICHDEPVWFLEDIGHPEWGIEMLEPDLDEKLDQLIEKHGNLEYDSINQQLTAAQERLWQTTLGNMRQIATVLSR